MTNEDFSRRMFMAALGASAWAIGCQGSGSGGEVPKGPLPGAPSEEQVVIPPGSMPMREFGATGVRVSAIGIGGFHMGTQKSEDESIRIVRTAIEHGVTFMDNCWDYNDGKSEERMGKALAGGYREKVFLMSKIDGRTRVAAAEQIDQSLKRLRTEVIDLMQVHEVIRMEDPARVFASGGAIEALARAKETGKIRFIGFTGHKDPAMHNAMLDEAEKHGFRFDSVQMPLNVMDPHFKSFEKNVLPRLVKSKIAVIGMKPMGSGIILKTGVVTAQECLDYALSLPTSVVVTGCDSVGVLKQAIAKAYRFQPLPQEQVAALLERTALLGRAGEYEKFKISNQFDGTAKNPHWLETANL